MRPHYTFQLLAPRSSNTGRVFRSQIRNGGAYHHYLKDTQRLRGRLYLEDGAISKHELDSDGCFHMPGDSAAWHLMLLDGDKRVIGCARYLVHPKSVAFESLRIAHSPLARNPEWSAPMRQAVEADLEIARRHNLRYVEVGGWALAEEWRGTRAALEIAVGSFALGLMWGGAIGSCTATCRHSSAPILRRLGGEPLRNGDMVIPPYHDAAFDCQMELLRFDYRKPADRYFPLVDHLARELGNSPLVMAEPEAPYWGAAQDSAAAPRLLAAPGF